MAIREEVEALRNRAWTTAGARYNAARRLRLRSKLSLVTISLVSALGVATPLLLSSSFLEVNRDSISLYSAVLSLFILVIAIMETAAGFQSKSDLLFRNAEQLNAFRLLANIALADTDESLTVQRLTELTNRYSQIKMECPLNHEVVDLKLHHATHPTDFGLSPSNLRRWAAYFMFYIFSTWWLLLIICAVVIGFFSAI